MTSPACTWGGWWRRCKATDVTNTQVVELITAGRSATRLHPSGGGGMSATPTASRSSRSRPRRARPGSARPSGAYWERIKGGDLGALPAVIGAVILAIVFGALQPDSFLTEQNFANLLNQGAAIIVLAMGLVFVLLLGEIDLSAGFTAGTGAAILGVTLTEHGWAWPLAILVALAAGVAIGWTIALLVARLGIPSFVVSLAYFLGFAGRDAVDHRRGRDDPDPLERRARCHEPEHAGRGRLAVRGAGDRGLRRRRRSWRSSGGGGRSCRRRR